MLKNQTRRVLSYSNKEGSLKSISSLAITALLILGGGQPLLRLLAQMVPMASQLANESPVIPESRLFYLDSYLQEGYYY